MKRFALIIPLCLLFVSGCTIKAGQAEFYDVVRDHQEITKPTNDAVIASIRDELEQRDDLSEEEQAAVADLIARLELITRQSNLIHEYVFMDEVDQEMIARLIRNRWINTKGKTQ